MANFDIQAIKNPSISGTGYQQGPQAGFWNLREYILLSLEQMSELELQESWKRKDPSNTSYWVLEKG